MPQYQFVLIFQSCRKDTTVSLLFPRSCGDDGKGELILRVLVLFHRKLLSPTLMPTFSPAEDCLPVLYIILY